MRSAATGRISLGVPLLFAACLAGAQNLILPQIADGGGWQTTLVLTNTTTSATSAGVSFFREINEGATQSWNLSFLETSSTQNLSLAAGGTLFLHTPGTAGATTMGWAQVQASSAVVAYAIFTQRVPGRQDQDGTAQAAAGATRFLVPFDNTNGFVTTIAVANSTSATESVSVGIQPTLGASSQPSPIALPPHGHLAFALPQQFSATSGQSGLLELYSASGGLSALGLRFNPTGAFTASPVYSEAGPPIIGGGSSSGGLTLTQFNAIQIGASPSSLPPPAPGLPSPPELGITLLVAVANGSSSGGQIQGVLLDANGQTTGTYRATWSSVTLSSQTLTFNGTFNGLEVSTSLMQIGTLAADITTASLTVILSPQVVSTSGTVTGSLALVSTLGTVSGSFTGTYTAQ